MLLIHSLLPVFLLNFPFNFYQYPRGSPLQPKQSKGIQVSLSIVSISSSLDRRSLFGSTTILLQFLPTQTDQGYQGLSLYLVSVSPNLHRTNLRCTSLSLAAAFPNPDTAEMSRTLSILCQSPPSQRQNKDIQVPFSCCSLSQP